jgi:FMN phosphatase YigB (HAD superfamily)
MFKISAERIGEAAENILYVGDRIDMDIIPALKIGFKPALIKKINAGMVGS